MLSATPQASNDQEAIIMSEMLDRYWAEGGCVLGLLFGAVSGCGSVLTWLVGGQISRGDVG